MNIFYIFLIVGIITAFELGKDLFKRFSNKKKVINFQEGANWVLNHIYKQVKEKGEIELSLDKEKMILIEKNGRNH